MNNTYRDLIERTYDFPQEAFNMRNNHLTFHGISLMHLIEKYGTPFRFIYLPKIGDQINRAKNLFRQAINKNNYPGKYHFCYCTKCNHFFHVIAEALKHHVNLETSSAFDIDLILKLYEKGEISLQTEIIHNGFKTDDYLEKIIRLQEAGFENSIIILDNEFELSKIEQLKQKNTRMKIGLRMATEEEVQSQFYTSRLGIQHTKMIDFYRNFIHKNEHFELKMLHFFVDSGIKDSLYYWAEFNKAVKLYTTLKKSSPSLSAFNIGGGFPISNNLNFEYDYKNIANQIVLTLKEACIGAGVPAPDIYTEFGKYTVGESGAIIFEVLQQKKQNDKETWYIINNSLMNTIPDAWSIKEKFILLPINKWDNEYHTVNIGGLSCDQSDYYNSEDFNQTIRMPKFSESDKKPLYLGFFNTGAYQDAISGYGGIKHCLIPSPKHVVIDRDEKGNVVDYLYRDEQTAAEMFKILGY